MHNPDRQPYIGHAGFTPYNQQLPSGGDPISCTGGHYPNNTFTGSVEIYAIGTNGKLDNLTLEVESLHASIKALATVVASLEDAVEKLLADIQKG